MDHTKIKKNNQNLSIRDTLYDHTVWQGMSQESGRESDDIASETEQFDGVSEFTHDAELEAATNPYDETKLRTEEVEEDSQQHDTINTESAPYQQPENTGEQEVSGSTPDPTSDDDMLQNVQDVGGQRGETSEKPKELDPGVDASEEDIKHH